MKKEFRADHELAACVREWGWKYHHLGIPTKDKMPDEKYLPHLKFYVSGFSTCPFGIEWMRFESGCTIHPLIQAVPHLAFEVQDVDYELSIRQFNVITPPNSPSDGVRVAMIEYNGASVELIEFTKDKAQKESEVKNIKTDRLILRPVALEDANTIFQYRSDVVENKYQGWIPASIDEVHDFIKNKVSQTIDVAGTWFQFVIITVDEQKLIGDIGIHFMSSDNAQVEIGYTLDKAFQGNGYATEALNAVVNYIFQTLKKHRITASIDPDNTASIKLVERLGFRKEAHFRKSLLLRGEWVDDCVYAILKEYWKEER